MAILWFEGTTCSDERKVKTFERERERLNPIFHFLNLEFVTESTLTFEKIFKMLTKACPTPKTPGNPIPLGPLFLNLEIYRAKLIPWR